MIINTHKLNYQILSLNIIFFVIEGNKKREKRERKGLCKITTSLTKSTTM